MTYLIKWYNVGEERTMDKAASIKSLYSQRDKFILIGLYSKMLRQRNTIKRLTPHTIPRKKWKQSLYVQETGLYANHNTEARTDQESICGNGKADCRK